MSLALANTVTTTRTTSRHTVELSDEALRNLIGAPKGARIYVSIPGGGDWSNMDLDISKGHPVVIEWEDVAEVTS